MNLSITVIALKIGPQLLVGPGGQFGSEWRKG